MELVYEIAVVTVSKFSLNFVRVREVTRRIWQSRKQTSFITFYTSRAIHSHLRAPFFTTTEPFLLFSTFFFAGKFSRLSFSVSLLRDFRAQPDSYLIKDSFDFLPFGRILGDF